VAAKKSNYMSALKPLWLRLLAQPCVQSSWGLLLIRKSSDTAITVEEPSICVIASITALKERLHLVDELELAAVDD
jgi:hypothetical protein